MGRLALSRREFALGLGAVVATTRAPGVFGRSAGAQAEATPQKRAGLIRLNFNENPYGPGAKALAAMTGSEPAAMRYPDAAYSELQKEIAALHKIAPERVILGFGSTEILRVADMAFLGADKNVVAAAPTFEAVLDYARVMQDAAVRVPLTLDWRHDLPVMAAQCTSRTGVVYVCNPNNPTGTIVTRKEMQQFFDQVPATTLILFDEAYHHFVDSPNYASATEWLDKVPNLLVARTFSKVYGLAGMRIGYGIGSKEVIAAMSAQLLQDNGSSAGIAAARAALADQAHVAECRARINASRAWLTKEMKKLGCKVTDSQANFLMVDMLSDVGPFIAEFRKRGILVGRKFPSMASWLRVTIGTQDETAAFMKAFREIYCGGNYCGAAARVLGSEKKEISNLKFQISD
jgi:histidinol-phosphate aminotransferase